MLTLCAGNCYENPTHIWMYVIFSAVMFLYVLKLWGLKWKSISQIQKFTYRDVVNLKLLVQTRRKNWIRPRTYNELAKYVMRINLKKLRMKFLIVFWIDGETKLSSAISLPLLFLFIVNLRFCIKYTVETAKRQQARCMAFNSKILETLIFSRHRHKLVILFCKSNKKNTLRPPVKTLKACFSKYIMYKTSGLF